MPRLFLRGLILTAAILALLLAPAAHAAPVGPADTWSALSSWLEQLWTFLDTTIDEGIGIDPHGVATPVSAFDEAGIGIDPHGQPVPSSTDGAGCSIVPHGGPVCAGQDGDEGVTIDPSG